MGFLGEPDHNLERLAKAIWERNEARAEVDRLRAALTVIQEYAMHDIDHDLATTNSMMWSIEAEARAALKGTGA